MPSLDSDRRAFLRGLAALACLPACKRPRPVSAGLGDGPLPDIPRVSDALDTLLASPQSACAIETSLVRSFFLGGFECSTHCYPDGRRLDLTASTQHDRFTALDYARLTGLGMHSAARITYNLDRAYRAFQSELAIDDSTGGRGSATCRIFTDDGSGRWRLKYEGPILRGGQQPVPVNVDLAGAKRLSLLVDFADRGDEQDHVDWLDARLIP